MAPPPAKAPPAVPPWKRGRTSPREKSPDSPPSAPWPKSWVVNKKPPSSTHKPTPENPLAGLRIEDCILEPMPKDQKPPPKKGVDGSKDDVAQSVRRAPAARSKFNLFVPNPSEPLISGKKVKLAIVDLFAGLRTVHVAARKLKNLIVVLSHAAENDAFANGLARNN